MLVLRCSSRQVAGAEEEVLGTDRIRELLDLAFEGSVKDQDPDREMRWNWSTPTPASLFPRLT